MIETKDSSKISNKMDLTDEYFNPSRYFPGAKGQTDLFKELCEKRYKKLIPCPNKY